ncbi:MAG: M3 family oligoendopeptidase [Anaerolineaceae bacterium]|nr:M3 family oligoendopeptidase [Anaerolineaceae bacterium]
MAKETPPRWDLKNVYPALASSEYAADFTKLKQLIADQGKYFTDKVNQTTASGKPDELAEVAGVLIERFNAILLVAGTLRAYVESFVSTNSYDQEALKKESELDQVMVDLDKLEVQTRAWIGQVADRLDEFIPLIPATEAHRFYIKESAEQSKYLMSPPEEILAAELNLSGGNAWSKLQGKITSQISLDFNLDGKVQKMPITAVINLRAHPEEDVRRRAYEAENSVWETVKEPLAAAMNGIKGEVNTLNRHRGRTDALHSAIDAARIDRPTLEVMLEAMKDSFPMFRRYFKAKAKRFGQKQLPWWNLFAPVGETTTTYQFTEPKDFILAKFGEFSPDLRAFANRAFTQNWIDAEMRDGKRGGAFCMDVPGVGESRVMCNFDGSLDALSTVAHELGHGFHNDCAVQAGKTEIQKFTPMTMAETASIMCETIVSEASLLQAKTSQEKLAILESQLIGDSQVIVDIYSRYLFEKEVFENREKSELSADELCEIMLKAQKDTFGDGLDEKYLQKWMWTWKPHYYWTGLSFYNFPYAFGLLFGTGLYAIYQQRGAEFVPDYKNLLAGTGEASATDLAARFGIDIRTKAFWKDSLEIIGKRVERYCEL